MESRSATQKVVDETVSNTIPLVTTTSQTDDIAENISAVTPDSAVLSKSNDDDSPILRRYVHEKIYIKK